MENNTYDKLIFNLNELGLHTNLKKEEYINSKQKIEVTDGYYKAYIFIYNYVATNHKNTPRWFCRRNPFIIYNINQYMKRYKYNNFICISSVEDYHNRDSILEFKCNRCGKIIKKSWFNSMIRCKDDSRKGITCDFCDGSLESLHALVLKQVFIHEYNDTIVEDKSCINPNNGSIMPTDIVNHRMKIAIEVQGQWHKFEKQKIRDSIKKEYWINRGYKFYDYEIEGRSVIEYLKLFFPYIDKIPDYVDLNYNHKINVLEIQELLNSGMKVKDISQVTNINIHRIYDAIHSGKLYYPDGYVKGTNKKIVKLDDDNNIVEIYDSYKLAENDNNIRKGFFAENMNNGYVFKNGSNWMLYDKYLNEIA